MSLADGTTRSLQIVAGSSQVTFAAPNTFTYRLPAAGLRLGRDEVMLKSLTMYFSWPNISSAKGNNSFSYTWPDGTTHSVVMPDGQWQFSQILDYLHQVMTTNGHYLVENGRKVFFLDFVVNPVLYCLSLTATPLPATLPSGWSNPASVDLVATDGKSPQMVIPAGMSPLTGFAAGTYPAAPSTSVYQVNSGVPQISDVSSLNIVSNLVNNSDFSLSPNILTSFVVPVGQEPGTLITVEPNNPDWVPMQRDQVVTEITLSLVDQLMRPVTIRDPAGFVAILNLRRRI